jgi:DNA-binding SARP family transcriptional activator
MSARIEAHIGEPALALDMLDRLEGSIGEAPNSRWIRRLEAALAAFRLGDEDRARNMIVAAKAMVDAMGLPDLPRRLEGPMVTRLAAMWPGSPNTEPARITSVTMFGTFAVRAGDQDVTPPAGHPSTLLKLLVLQRTMTVDAAIDSLWPDADAERGRARLRNTMNRLRTRSGPCIERRGDVLELTDTVRTDVEVFDRAATAALTADASTRIGLARQAISLYAGELLPGDVFEDWAAAPRERMLRRYVGLIDLVADAAEREGDHDEAARLLDLGVAADPLEERRYVRLAQVLTTQGRVTAARRVAEQGIAVFAEIGLSPSPELARLGG